MNRIRISSNNIEQLKNSRNFKLGIQLSRLLNVIRANQRQYLRIEDNDDPANMRDRLELILYHGAIVFEAIRTLLSYSKDLRSLKSWSDGVETVRKIQREFNDKNSFTQNHLKLIRNKILFHYEISTIENILADYSFRDNSIFAEAKSEKTLDLAFLLADELLINYLIQNITEDIPDSEKWGYFEEKLLEISNDLSNLLYSLVLDLLGDCIYVEEG